MFTLQTSFKHFVQLGGGGGMGLWAPVLLWNPAILLLQNITKSIKTMLKLTFYPNTHVYQHNTHKML
jgi:hypothetical protein